MGVDGVREKRERGIIQIIERYNNNWYINFSQAIDGITNHEKQKKTKQKKRKDTK